MKANPSRLDTLDLEILTELQANARTSNAKIGRGIGMVASGVLQRVRKLEKRGVISGYETRIDPGAVGLELAAFIAVRVGEPVGSLDAAGELAALDEVQELHHVAGEDCYLLKVRLQNPQELGRFLRERLGAIDSVESTRTTIVLETIKETGRLPLRPLDSPE